MLFAHFDENDMAKYMSNITQVLTDRGDAAIVSDFIAYAVRHQDDSIFDDDDDDGFKESMLREYLTHSGKDAEKYGFFSGERLAELAEREIIKVVDMYGLNQSDLIDLIDTIDEHGIDMSHTGRDFYALLAHYINIGRSDIESQIIQWQEGKASKEYEIVSDLKGTHLQKWALLAEGVSCGVQAEFITSWLYKQAHGFDPFCEP